MPSGPGDVAAGPPGKAKLAPPLRRTSCPFATTTVGKPVPLSEMAPAQFHRAFLKSGFNSGAGSYVKVRRSRTKGRRLKTQKVCKGSGFLAGWRFDRAKVPPILWDSNEHIAQERDPGCRLARVWPSRGRLHSA